MFNWDFYSHHQQIVGININSEFFQAAGHGKFRLTAGAVGSGTFNVQAQKLFDVK